MPGDYDGPERRAETCENHVQNTNDLTSLKTSTATIRWVIQVGLPIAVAVLSAFAALAYNGVASSLEGIQSDVRDVKQSVNSTAVGHAVTQAQIVVIQRDIVELKGKVESFHDPHSK